MTWQRIDENTYIDDTLVTCTEFQLFIDEMRLQGKNYQPFHWKSERFPEGQAHQPIIGVFFAAAKAFCEWLTNRDTNKWKYRLPTQKETSTFPISIEDQAFLNYWIYDESPNGENGWITTIPREGDTREGIRLVKERTR